MIESLYYYRVFAHIRDNDMKKKKDGRRIWKVLLWISAMLIVVFFSNIWYWVIAFDTNEDVTDYKGINQKVYYSGYEINESNDSWETTIQLSDDSEAVGVYTGTTCSCDITNENYFNIKNWKLRLDISQDCYLNGFWCGSFEVHQFRNGQEIVNLVENQAADISGMNIDHNLYSDTNLIHLVPGDYLIYLPSADAKEDVVNGYSSVGIGYIFYYQGDMDLSHWILTYSNDLRMTDVLSFRIALVLLLLWVAALVLYLSLGHMEKRLTVMMNNRIRNISIMTDLYIEAFIIDTVNNTAHLIKGNENNILWNIEGDNVQESVNKIVLERCSEMYREELTEFLDLSTILERMEGVSSISSEYYDEELEWCAIRLFKDNEKNSRNQIVFTVQDINEEKEKFHAVEDRMNLAEYKQNVSGSFLETVSFALNSISENISIDAKTILNSPADEDVKALADRVVMNTRHMNLIQNTMIDLYEIECKRLELDIRQYNIYDMVDELHHILKPFAEGKPFDFIFDVDKNIPTVLEGDSDRIEQILVIILFSSMLMTQHGFVKFSVFGKRHDDEEEMIFSIRDSAKGFTEEELNEIHEFINGASIETFDNASLVYLKIINGILSYMNSELKIVSVVNEGTDFFFTLRQKIIE